MESRYVLAIDQGMSGTRAVVFDGQGHVAAQATEPLQSCFPRPSFVEQDPLEIYDNVLAAVKACLREFLLSTSGTVDAIAACGIAGRALPQTERWCRRLTSSTPDPHHHRILEEPRLLGA